MRGRLLRALFAIVASALVLCAAHASPSAGVKRAVEKGHDSSAFVVPASSGTQLAPREGERRPGPLFVLALALAVLAVAAPRLHASRGLLDRIGVDVTRIAAQAWSRRGPPLHPFFV